MTQHRLLEDPSITVAVVGATDSPGKYGGIIYRFLKARGYQVLAVNPHRGTVDGDRTYPDLTSLPRQADIINLVVPVETGDGIVREAARLGYPGVWLQPGADDPALIELAEELGLDVVAGDCIMVVSRLALR